MKILIAILLPPLAILLCGRVVLAMVFAVLWIVSIVLCFVGIGFAFLTILAIAAVYVVINTDANKRIDKLTNAIERSRS